MGLGLGGRAVGGEAVVDGDHGPVGHDVAGHAALDPDRLQRLAVLAAVEHRAPPLVAVEPLSTRPRRWMALRPIHGRAVWARSPRSTIAHPHRALAAGLDPAVGRLAEDGDVAGQQVGTLGEEPARAR